MASSHHSQIPITTLLPNLLLILALATGIVVTDPSLSTDRILRPETASTKPDQTTGIQSPFWEDPMQLAPKEALPAPEASKSDKRLLKNRLHEEFRADDDLLVLFAGLEGGGSPQAKEARIRTRVAIASAFAGRCSMLVSFSQEQLKPCIINIPSRDDRGLKEARGATMEVFEGLNLTGSRWFKVAKGKVAVVYLDESTIKPTPANMAALVQEAALAPSGKASFAYLGLTRSERLWSFMGAAVANLRKKGLRYDSDNTQTPITVYSPYASAEDILIWQHVGKAQNRNVMNEAEELRLRDKTRHLPFATSYRFQAEGINGTLHRVGADDGDLARALVAELEIRGIGTPAGKSIEIADLATEKDDGHKKDAVLLLADMDRYHSRALVTSFSKAWQEKRNMSTTSPDLVLSTELAKTVRVFHYTEGLDAPQATAPGTSTPGGSKPSPAPAQGSSPPNSALGGKYAAEGHSHFDALRRLPSRLRGLEQEDRVRYRAIGLLGSDTHDKLLLLKALKPVFPEAVFFTNDLDARLWQGDDRSASMNLVVAGAFGLTLDGTLQGSVPPFRSCLQTSAYLSCLDAVGFAAAKGEEPLMRPSKEVEIHEVGRSGDHLLSFFDPKGNWKYQPASAMSHRAAGRPSSTDIAPDQPTVVLTMFRLILLIVLAGMLFHIWWPVLQYDSQVQEGPWDLKTMTRWSAMVTFLVAILWGLAFKMPEIARRDHGGGEAQAILSGISAIPVAISNLIVLALALVMILHLFRTQPMKSYYPFTGSCALTPPTALTDAEVRTWTGFMRSPNRASLRDVCSYTTAVWKWCTKREKRDGFPRIPEDGEVTVIAEFRRFARYMFARENRRRKTWLGRPPENRLISTYARELLAASIKNTIVRVLLILLMTFVFFSIGILPSSQDLPPPPFVRGPEFRLVFEVSEWMARFALAVIAAVALDRQMSVAIGIDKFCRYLEVHDLNEDEKDIDNQGRKKRKPKEGNESITPPYDWVKRPEVADDVLTKNLMNESKEQDPNGKWSHEKSGHTGLWELPLLRMAAQRFRIVSPVMLMPFILLFIMLVSRHPAIESISLPIWEILLFAVILLGPLTASALAQHNMARAFTLVTSRLRRGARFVSSHEGSANAREKFFKHELDACSDLDARTRFGIFKNPIVEAILLPLGGYGVLEFSSLFASFLK